MTPAAHLDPRLAPRMTGKKYDGVRFDEIASLTFAMTVEKNAMTLPFFVIARRDNAVAIQSFLDCFTFVRNDGK